ncbi:MAG TPA: hypothetical protein PKK61_07185 [Defluviitaleaceae bacterium]|jgi:hypothetical protein|nr:hypothetical protein [Defluviitaleaceae bacterium]
MKGNNEIRHANVLSAFLLSINPAIKEEILYRTVFYALCLSAVNGELTTKGERFTYYFMMMIPHILPHTANSFQYFTLNEFVVWFISIILYAVIFGSIFTILQKNVISLLL